jgi:hypothetical protein
MVPSHLRTAMAQLRDHLIKSDALKAANLLLTLATGPRETVRQMQDELVEALFHPCLEPRREELFTAFANGVCFPLHRPHWKVTVVTRDGMRLRITRDDRGRIVEICALDKNDQPAVPHIVLDHDRQRGHARFRTTADSFGKGRAVAGTMYSDDPLEATMSWEEWRDSTLKGFTR